MRRHILETANQGLQMDTDKLIGQWYPNLCPVNDEIKLFRIRIQSKVVRRDERNTCSLREIHEGYI